MTQHLVTIKITVAPHGPYGAQAAVAHSAIEQQFWLDPTLSLEENRELVEQVRILAISSVARVQDQLYGAWRDANPDTPVTDLATPGKATLRPDAGSSQPTQAPHPEEAIDAPQVH